MPQQVQGVIARSKAAPVELVDIVIPDPGPNDVVVRVRDDDVDEFDGNCLAAGDDTLHLLWHDKDLSGL